MEQPRPLVRHISAQRATQAEAVKAAAEWLIRHELLWLAILSPLFLFPERGWAWIVGAIPLLWAARWVARGRFLPRTPLDWPLAIMSAMVPVSLFATFSIEYSLGKVIGLLFGIALYYALVEWASSAKRAQWVMWGLLAGGGVLSVIGLVGTNWMSKLEGVGIVTNSLPALVRGLPGAENGFHPNEVGGALLWVVLPALALAIWAFRRGPCSTISRVAIYAIVVLSLGTMVLTQSRGALVAAFAGLLLLSWLLFRRVRPWLVGAFVLALVALVLSGPDKVVNKLFDPAVVGYPTSDPANMHVRLDIWGSALEAIRDAPLTGIGMNTFRVIMPERYPSPLFPPGFDIAHAHNIFLQAALDLGLPGMLAYLALWIITCALLAKAWRRAVDPWSRFAVAGVGAGLFASFVFGMTDALALGAKPGIFFWASLALIFLLWRRPQDDESRSTSSELPVEGNHGEALLWTSEQ